MDPISKRRSIIEKWGEDTNKASAVESSQIPRITLSSEGTWVLEGHEAELEQMESTVPLLQSRLIAGVKAEQEQELRTLESLYKGGEATIGRLQMEGVILVGLSAQPYGQLYQQQLWRFVSSRHPELPYHKFKAGDGVLLTRYAPENSGSFTEAIDATICQSKRDHLIIALGQQESESLSSSKSLWRCDQSIRDTTAMRQLEAIKRLSKLPQSPSEQLIRCIIAGSTNSSLIAEQPPIWVRDKGWRDDAKEALARETGLNNSQRRAVAKSMTSGFTLWQGPPGK